MQAKHVAKDIARSKDVEHTTSLILLMSARKIKRTSEDQVIKISSSIRNAGCIPTCSR